MRPLIRMLLLLVMTFVSGCEYGPKAHLTKTTTERTQAEDDAAFKAEIESERGQRLREVQCHFCDDVIAGDADAKFSMRFMASDHRLETAAIELPSSIEINGILYDRGGIYGAGVNGVIYRRSTIYMRRSDIDAATALTRRQGGPSSPSKEATNEDVIRRVGRGEYVPPSDIVEIQLDTSGNIRRVPPSRKEAPPPKAD